MWRKREGKETKEPGLSKTPLHEKKKKWHNAMQLHATQCSFMQTLTWTFNKSRLGRVGVARHCYSALRAVDELDVVGDVDPKEAAVLQKRIL